MHIHKALFFVLWIGLIAISVRSQTPSVSFTVHLPTSPQHRTTPFDHFWERCVGSGHAALALRSDWQKQMALAKKELGFQMVRFHGLLTDDVNVVLRDVNQPERIVFSFHNVDLIFEYLLSIGMKPIVELSFMPEVFASDPSRTCFHYKGGTSPPKDMNQWASLMRELVKHLIERFGVQEVRKWYFEVWNEPNLSYFWPEDSQDIYFQLYNATAHAIKSVDPKLRVGGPATAASEWIDDFLSFVNKYNVPMDFVATHSYPTDVRPFHRDALKLVTAKTRAKIGRNVPLFYTEWNSGLNDIGGGTFFYHDGSYPAAFVVKNFADVQPYVDIFSYWTFSDIFEEQGMMSQPFSQEFGMMTIQGIRKPVWRAFQLLHEAGDKRINVTEHYPRGPVDILTTYNDKTKQVMIFVTNYNIPTAPQEQYSVKVDVIGKLDLSSVTLRKVDENNANAFTTWKEIGSPTYPNEKQLEILHEASELKAESIRPRQIFRSGQDDTHRFDLLLPPSSLHVITLTSL